MGNNITSIDIEAIKSDPYVCMKEPRVALKELTKDSPKSMGEIAKEIGITQSYLSQILANDGPRPSCALVTKSCIHFNLNPFASEGLLRGFGHELDCRLVVYQRYRRLIAENYRRTSSLRKDKNYCEKLEQICAEFIALVEIMSKESVECKKEAWISSLLSEAEQAARKYDLKAFCMQHWKALTEQDNLKGFLGSDLSYFTLRSHFNNTQTTICLKTLLQYAKVLQLTWRDTEELLHIVGTNFYANDPKTAEIRKTFFKELADNMK